MKYYTGRGDDGRTDLQGGKRVSKTSSRIEAYGTVDELNCIVGTVRARECSEEVDDTLQDVQNNLHIIQSELSDPSEDSDTPRLGVEAIENLEDYIDTYTEQTPELESFILPTGTKLAADLHQSRAVARRAERRVVDFANSEPVNENIPVYMNRLSDLMFALARYVNDKNGFEEDSPTY